MLRAQTPAWLLRPGERLSLSDHIDGFFAFALVDRGRVGYFLAFGQRAHAAALERADMHEHVRTAIVGLNETKAFLVVEEFDSSWGHRELHKGETHAELRAISRCFFGSCLRCVGEAFRARLRSLIVRRKVDTAPF